MSSPRSVDGRLCRRSALSSLSSLTSLSSFVYRVCRVCPVRYRRKTASRRRWRRHLEVLQRRLEDLHPGASRPVLIKRTPPDGRKQGRNDSDGCSEDRALGHPSPLSRDGTGCAGSRVSLSHRPFYGRFELSDVRTNRAQLPLPCSGKLRTHGRFDWNRFRIGGLLSFDRWEIVVPRP